MGRRPILWHEAAVIEWILSRDIDRTEAADRRARLENRPAELTRLRRRGVTPDPLVEWPLDELANSGLEVVEGVFYRKTQVNDLWPRPSGRPLASRRDRRIIEDMANYLLGLRTDVLKRRVAGKGHVSFAVEEIASDTPRTRKDLAEAFGFGDESDDGFKRVWSVSLQQAQNFIDARKELKPVEDNGNRGNPAIAPLDLETLQGRLDQWKRGAVRGRITGSKNRHG